MQHQEPVISESKNPGPVELTGLYFQQVSLQNASIPEALGAQACATLRAKEPGLMSNFQR